MNSLRISLFFLQLSLFLHSAASINPVSEEPRPDDEGGIHLGFAFPSHAPSISSTPTVSSMPSLAPSITSAPSVSSMPSLAPSKVKSSSPSTKPSSLRTPSAAPITKKPTRTYTTNPTSAPTVTSVPVKTHGFGYYVVQTIKWMFIIAICGVLGFFAFKHWDQIYYFLMECLHHLRVCCAACLMKTKEMCTRMVIRINSARNGGGAGGEDGTMLDGLLMGSR